MRFQGGDFHDGREEDERFVQEPADYVPLDQ